MDPVTQAELALKVATAERQLAEAKESGSVKKIKTAKEKVRAVREDARGQLEAAGLRSGPAPIAKKKD